MLVILLSLSKIVSFLIARYEFIDRRFMLYHLLLQQMRFTLSHRNVIDQIDRPTRPLLERLDYHISTLPHITRR
jgi:hypothetical protein